MATARQNTGLQIIFSIFLGLMVAAFFGVGVFTFYPPPETKYQDQLDDLYQQQADLQEFKEPTQLTAAEKAQLNELQKKIRALEDKQQAEREVWGRNTSIVLIAFATLVMSISLIRADQLPVISNGLLLGGVFTMIYGVGWIIATGTSYARFAVMTVALAITLGLGYVRFVRVRQAQAGAPEPTATSTGAVSLTATEASTLAARVDALERRIDAAAHVLGESRARGPSEK
jgi:uncharacterized protein HemX